MEPVQVTVGCPECESVSSFKVERPRSFEGKAKDSVTIRSRLLRASPLILKMLAEEKEHQSKAVEDFILS